MGDEPAVEGVEDEWFKAAQSVADERAMVDGRLTMSAAKKAERGSVSLFNREIETHPTGERLLNIDTKPAHARLLNELGHDYALDTGNPNPIQVMGSEGGRARIRLAEGNDEFLNYVEDYVGDPNRGDKIPAGFSAAVKELNKPLPAKTQGLLGEQPIAKGQRGAFIPGDDLKKIDRRVRASNASILGKHKTTTPGRIVNKTKADQGYTVNLQTGEVPQSGLMMGKYANDDERNFVLDELKRANTEAFAKKNKGALSSPNQYLGTWFNKRHASEVSTPIGRSIEGDDKYYLDVSKRFPSDHLRHATKFGEKTKQKKGFNLDTFKEFPVGNWQEFVQGPEFEQRMIDMQKIGQDYMSQFPAKEWWDMHGDSSFNRIYGEENLPHIAGFMGSTAPNTAPEENLRLMTEYMRRKIKGEETIQPNYRIPESAVHRTPGSEIGMEAGRIENLKKSAKGLWDEISGNKVSHEARALMGDPDAVVIDRHHVRATEVPERGIYAGTDEGAMPKETDKAPSAKYDMVADAIRSAAKKRDRTPRDFSAEVWVGIRESIKNNAEVFGVKYKAGSVTGPSKSYADTLDDLVKVKADHFKVSIPEMEKRLRAGDAELFSAILATPAGMAIFEMAQSIDEPAVRPGLLAPPS